MLKNTKKLPKVRIVWFKADFDINIFHHHHSLSAVMMMSRRRKSSSCLQTQTESSFEFSRVSRNVHADDRKNIRNALILKLFDV